MPVGEIISVIQRSARFETFLPNKKSFKKIIQDMSSLDYRHIRLIFKRIRCHIIRNRRLNRSEGNYPHVEYATYDQLLLFACNHIKVKQKKSKSLWMWVMYSNLSALQRKCPFWLNFFRLLNASLALRSFFAYKIQRANTWIPPKLKETCSSKRQGLYFFWMSINYMMNKYIKDSIVLLLTAQYWERAASTWNLDGNSQ